jgi:hypothetical protein
MADKNVQVVKYRHVQIVIFVVWVTAWTDAAIYSAFGGFWWLIAPLVLGLLIGILLPIKRTREGDL